MIKIEITTIKRINKKKTKEIALSILKEEKCSKCEVYINFVDSKYIRKLNKKFRKINKETEVLAFPIDISDKLVSDIYVCVDKCKNKEEVYKFMIHGLLHAIGYNHSEAMSEKELFYFNKFCIN